MVSLIALLLAASAPTILLVLIAVVLVFGIGVLVVNRRRMGVSAPPPALPARPAPPKPPKPPKPIAPPTDLPTDLQAGAAVDEAVAEPAELVEQEEMVDEGAATELLVLERPSFRDRLSRARATFTGAITGVRGRSGITGETWDDLEEALLRADVGVRVTDELLDGLRARVKAKEITTPDELLGALQGEMKSRLAPSDRTLRFERAARVSRTSGCSSA